MSPHISEGWRLAPDERTRMRQEGIGVEDFDGQSGLQWPCAEHETAQMRRREIQERIHTLIDLPV